MKMYYYEKKVINNFTPNNIPIENLCDYVAFVQKYEEIYQLKRNVFILYIQKVVKFSWTGSLNDKKYTSYDPTLEALCMVLNFAYGLGDTGEKFLPKIFMPFITPRIPTLNDDRSRYYTLYLTFSNCIKCLNTCKRLVRTIDDKIDIEFSANYLNGVKSYISAIYIAYLGQLQLLDRQINSYTYATYLSKSVELFDDAIKLLKPFKGDLIKYYINNSEMLKNIYHILSYVYYSFDNFVIFVDSSKDYDSVLDILFKKVSECSKQCINTPEKCIRAMNCMVQLEVYIIFILEIYK